jgi:hypothetical protein
LKVKGFDWSQAWQIPTFLKPSQGGLADQVAKHFVNKVKVKELNGALRKIWLKVVL